MIACKIEGCARQQARGRRGLCLVCYSKAKNMVEKNQTTWDDLVRMGLAESTPTPFEAAFNKAKESDDIVRDSGGAIQLEDL
jgi:hypothetical protein